MNKSDDCPYVGLDPFTLRHARYFFGRALDSKMIADSVLTRPITVLYGTSGVGKTSVLNVGLPAALAKHHLKAALAARGCWQQASTLVAWLDKAFAEARHRPKQPLVVVLDQFEEYFLYRSAIAADAFEQALADLLSQRDINAHLLFSLRDDGLHLLDGLRLRLPSVLDSTFELTHLDDGAVHEAIEGPIEVYNRRKGAARAVRLGASFADDLLGDLRRSLFAIAPLRPTAPEQVAIELPFLQLVLRRLWEKMPARGKRVLDSALLNDDTVSAGSDTSDEKVSGVDRIVEAHVRGKLGGMSLGEQQLASDVFHYMVTPSGGKFAYAPKDLAEQASETAGRTIDAGDVGLLLHHLADPNARVLRRTGERFDLFHDVLARPVLRWRAGFLTTAPFGVLTEVVTGRVFPLYGGGYLFGRLADYRRETPLSWRPVSRNHFLILKNGQILDLRSLFGTTVNAKPLHFGDTNVSLSSGDIIGLANTGAVVFHTIADAPPEAVKEGARVADRGLGKGWGLLIDGETRRITGLSGATTYLAFDGSGALTTASHKRPEEAFAVLRRNDDGEVRIAASADEQPLTVIEREDAYHDRDRSLARDEEFVVGMRAKLPEWVKEVVDLARDEEFRIKLLEILIRRATSGMERAERGVFRLGERYFEIIIC